MMSRRFRAPRALLLASSTLVWAACGATTSPSTSTATGASLLAGYQQARWQPGVTVSFPDNCTMRYSSTGAPSHGQEAYYLVPNPAAPTVAVTPTGRLALSVSTVPTSTRVTSYTINICSAVTSTTTSTRGGSTGWMISGSAMFNAYEGDMVTIANADNVTYAFTDANGRAQTAAFLDACSGHQTPANAGNTYHYHGYSSCLASAAGDGTSGPSHIVGVALDGFAIYGDRDLTGALVPVSSLDQCNGITSPTPEFPAGVYHYVLPSGAERNTARAAPPCYRGSVSASLQLAIAASGMWCGAKASTTKVQLASVVVTSGGPRTGRRS